MNRRPIALMAAAALAAAACSAAAGDSATTTAAAADEPSVAGFVASGLDRSEPSASEADLAAAAAAERAFALDLYEALARSGGDLVFSPVSVHLALAMTLAGARGTTAQAMAEVLGVADIDQARLHDALNSLDQLLESYNRAEEELPDGTSEKVVVSIVNALWGQGGFGFEQDYLDLLATSYGAGMHAVDFAGAAEAARQEINGWVADQTNGRIEDLIPEGGVDALTRLVVTNAVYLDATWMNPFDAKATRPGEFTLLDGSVVTVPMMHGDPGVPYAAGDGWQAVELPYTGGDLGLLVIVPDEDRFSDVESALAGGLFDEVAGALNPASLLLSLPKFEIRSQVGLGTVLRALGMGVAFDPAAADFSGITSEEDLAISDVIHEAFIAVDEAGTEAAAATAVILRATSAPTGQVVLDVDRPFLFALRDRATGTLLFLGRVLDPSA